MWGELAIAILQAKLQAILLRITNTLNVSMTTRMRKHLLYQAIYDSMTNGELKLYVIFTVKDLTQH